MNLVLSTISKRLYSPHPPPRLQLGPIGDAWYYVEGETIHYFYLTCPNTIGRHTSWDIGHANA